MRDHVEHCQTKGTTVDVDDLLFIAGELSGTVTRAIAMGSPLDREVLRHWAERYHEALRKWRSQLAASAMQPRQETTP